MTLRKYQSVESSNVVEPDEVRQIEAATRKTGKTSVREMSADERRTLPQGDVDAEQ